MERPAKPRQPDSKQEGKTICDDCGQVLSRKSSLTRHKETHRSPQLWPFACAMCKKRFVQEGNLKRHMNSQHLHVRPYLCDAPSCGWAFADPATLCKHRKRVHKHVPAPRHSFARQSPSASVSSSLDELDGTAARMLLEFELSQDGPSIARFPLHHSSNPYEWENQAPLSLPSFRELVAGIEPVGWDT